MSSDGIPPERLVGRGYDDAVTLEDEVVVAAGGSVHRLNRTAAVVWSSFRSAADPGAVADELAARFGVPADVMLPDVMHAVQALLATGLLEPDRAAPVRRGLPVIEPLAACSGCGPGPRYDVHVLVAVGEVALAIGADVELADALAESFGPRVVGRIERPDARASYGVVVPERESGRVRTLARLHRGPDVLVRARQPLRVLHALVGLVGAHDLPHELTALEATLVGRNGRAVLVPPPPEPGAFERTCRSLGLAVSDGPVVPVDAATGDAVVGAPWIGVDPAPLTAIAEQRRQFDDPDPTLPDGRHALVAVGLSGVPGVARLLGDLGVGAPFAAPDAVARLERLAATVPLVEALSPQECAALLAAAG